MISPTTITASSDQALATALSVLAAGTEITHAALINFQVDAFSLTEKVAVDRVINITRGKSPVLFDALAVGKTREIRYRATKN